VAAEAAGEGLAFILWMGRAGRGAVRDVSGLQRTGGSEGGWCLQGELPAGGGGVQGDGALAAGVDACATPGMPIYAPATSVLIQPVLQNWYGPQPLMLLKFVPPLAGTYQGDEYWYVAEQITPVSEQVGAVFQAGQPVAHFASSGTCIEIGWGSPTTNMRALEPQYAQVSAGALTPGAEAFKRFFGIPWAGQSP